MYTRNKPKLF